MKAARFTVARTNEVAGGVNMQQMDVACCSTVGQGVSSELGRVE